MSGMTTTGIFTTCRKVFPFRQHNPLYLLIFGDVHRDSRLCAVDRWKEFLHYAKYKHNAVLLGMGDFMDFASTSERQILYKTELHDATVDSLEEMTMAKCEQFAKELRNTGLPIIGLLEGNHYGILKGNITTTQYICHLLKCDYLGVASFIRLVWRRPDGSTVATFDVAAHHGKGAARLVGGSLNRVLQMHETYEADLTIMGHDHKRGIIPTDPSLRLVDASGSLKVKERTRWVARSGSFLKAYVPGMASYNVDAARSPANLGWVEMELTPYRHPNQPTIGGKRFRKGGDDTGVMARGIA